MTASTSTPHAMQAVRMEVVTDPAARPKEPKEHEIAPASTAAAAAAVDCSNGLDGGLSITPVVADVSAAPFGTLLGALHAWPPTCTSPADHARLSIVVAHAQASRMAGSKSSPASMARPCMPHDGPT